MLLWVWCFGTAFAMPAPSSAHRSSRKEIALPTSVARQLVNVLDLGSVSARRRPPLVAAARYHTPVASDPSRPPAGLALVRVPKGMPSRREPPHHSDRPPTCQGSVMLPRPVADPGARWVKEPHPVPVPPKRCRIRAPQYDAGHRTFCQAATLIPRFPQRGSRPTRSTWAGRLRGRLLACVRETGIIPGAASRPPAWGSKRCPLVGSGRYDRDPPTLCQG